MVPAAWGFCPLMPSRIKVLHVITRLVVGGAQDNTLLTVRHLDRGRYDVTLASGPTLGSEGSLEEGIPPDLDFERIPALVRDPDPGRDAWALFHLCRLMRTRRYHVVHTHTTKAGLLGRVAARLAGVPVIVHTPHGHAFHDYLGPRGSAALMTVERGLARWTHRIVCLTEAEREDHLRFRIAAAGKFVVIHSGVDIDRFRRFEVQPEAKRGALGLPVHGPLVGCVARLVPVKGVRHLLEAAPLVRSAVPRVTIAFVGDGPLRAELEHRAAALGLNGTVRFLGLRRDVADIMPLCDVVVLPSLNEGMGRVAVEAQAAGRPVVGSRVSGLQDVVKDGETGLLVPPANPEALAAAIIRCLTDPARAAAMGSRAQQCVEPYAVATMISKIERTYEELLPARSAP